MSRKALIGLLVLLALLPFTTVSAQTATPATNWSYTFDLTANDYCFNFVGGEWVAGEGVKFAHNPDNAAEWAIVASRGFDFVVYPSTANFLFDFVGLEHFGSTNVYGDVYAFGLQKSTSYTFAADQFVIQGSPVYADAHGNSISVSVGMMTDPTYVTEDDYPVLRQITVGGVGANPFEGVDPRCFDGSTVTPTLTPSIAPTPSHTPTPSLTPSYTPSMTPSETPTPSLTPSPAPTASLLYWIYNWDDHRDFTPTYAGNHSETAGHSGLGETWISDAYVSGYYQYHVNFYVDVSSIAGAIRTVSWRFNRVGNPTGSPSAAVNLFFSDTLGGSTLRADGSYGVNPTVGGWQTANVSGINNSYDYMRISAFFNSTSDNLSIVMDDVVIGFDSSEATATATITPTFTPSLTLSPGPATATATATSTFSSPPTSAATATNPPPTSTRYPIQQFTLPPLGTLPPTTTPAAGTPTAIYVPATDIPGDAQGLGGFGGAIIAAGSNAMSQAFGYVGTLYDKAGGIVAAWGSTSPTPIAGLPRCASAPMLSQLCAIYYIIDNTILSGTLGSVIMPLAVAVLNSWLLLAFVKLVRAILARIAKLVTV